MSILNNINFFRDFPPTFTQNIKSFYVSDKGDAYCVLNDNNLYGLGETTLKKFGYKPNTNESNSNKYVLICELNIHEFYEGFSFYYARNNNNKIFSWGVNHYGHLGRGFRSGGYSKPKKVDFFDDKNIVQVSCGSFHCLALSSDGIVYGCGDNSFGQIGCGKQRKIVSTPIEIKFEEKIKFIYCTSKKSFAVNFDGIAYYWGEIHLPHEFVIEYPVKLSESIKVKSIINTFYDTSYLNVLSSDGIVYCSRDQNKQAHFEIMCDLNQLIQDNEEWNRDIITNLYFQNKLIVETKDCVYIRDFNQKLQKTTYQTLFEYFLFEGKKTYKTIHIKDNQLFVLNFVNEQDNSKQFVRIKQNETSSDLRKFRITNDLPQILDSNVKYYYQSESNYGNSYFALFVMNDNKVYCLGDNKFGNLGLGHSNRIYDYTEVVGLSDHNIEEFYEGSYNMFARSAKNEIFFWGSNIDGQLSNGFISQSEKYFSPLKLDYFDDKNIINLSCSQEHCLALSSNGQLYGWGNNDKGQVGCGQEKINIFHPLEIDLNEKIKFIHCWRSVSFAVSFKGNAYYWGAYDYFKENHGFTKLIIFSPKLIPLKNVIKLYYLRDYFIILDKNGKVFIFEPWIETKINEIETYEEFYDLGFEEYSLRCLLQSEDCVYQLDQSNQYDLGVEQYKVFKTNFINFFDYYYYSEKFYYYKKTFEITKEGYLMTKQINVNEEEKTLFLTEEYVFKRKYENIFEEINEKGRGGFGTVFEAMNKTNNILYAIKKVAIIDKLDLQEIKFMSKLNTDFVVKYIDSWIEGKYLLQKIKKYLYIQMELCSHNLRDIIVLMKEISGQIFKTFNYFISCELFKELIECVNYLHELKPPIIHRDLKPENILISDNIINGRFLKLCDFGLSQIFEDPVNTQLVGKYMAPEVRDGKYYPESDIYSLALIATEIFQFEDSVKKVKLLSDLHKYYNKSENTIFEKHFQKLLKLLEVCLSENYKERHGSKNLVDNINDIFIDKNIVKNESNYFQFRETLRNLNNNILELIFKFKLDGSVSNNISIERIYHGNNNNESKYKPGTSKSVSIYESMFDEICELGSGSFGTVFEVKNKSTNERFAIKKVKIQYQTDLREMKIISKLNNISNDFIVKYINIWIERKQCFKANTKFLFIQMELCSHSLRDFIDSMNTFYVKTFEIFCYFISCELFKELVECVNYLHELSPPIIHRDLKPENILISDGINGRFLKLCDFGLAKIHEKSEHTKGPGTRKYMAPEVRESENYNTKSDIYSLAIIATEIFQFEESVRKVNHISNLNKSINYTENTKFNIEYQKLIDLLEVCLLNSYEERPDTKKVLNKIKEFIIDKNIVNIDTNISKFRETVKKLNNNVMELVFELKLDSSASNRILIHNQPSADYKKESQEKYEISNLNSIYENMFDEISEISSGSFGAVFKVMDKSTNESFAIKRIKIQNPADLKEMDIITNWNKMSNNFIVKYINVWIETKQSIERKTDFLFIQMELCSNNLRDFIDLMKRSDDQRFQTFNYFISCEMFRELIECVNYLHSLNPPIIHRDLKPQNILISDNIINARFLKLCDFGLAKIHNKSEHTRGQGALEYMAPEVKDTQNYNTKSDIYSLALIGTEIFQFEDSVKKIRKLKNRENFDKYLSKYLNTILERNFKHLLEVLSKCLLPEDYHLRVECTELLNNSNELSIDYFILLNDENISRFESYLQKQDNLILKKCFETKFNVTFENILIYSDPRPEIIDKIISTMTRYIESNSICAKAMYYLSKISEKEKEFNLSTDTLQKLIRLTLLVMRTHRHHESLQSNALKIIKSPYILENIKFNWLLCAQLVMVTLVSFKEIDMNLMAVHIFCKVMPRILKDEFYLLHENDYFVEALIEIMRTRFKPFLIKNKNVYKLINKTLKVLNKLTEESQGTSQLVLSKGGLDLWLKILKEFGGHNSLIKVTRLILIVLSNISEVSSLRTKLMKDEFLSILRDLIKSQDFYISHNTTRILANLCLDQNNWNYSTLELSDILNDLEMVILKWEPTEKELASYNSLELFVPFLSCFDSPAIQLWAIWTLHHIFTKNANRYYQMLVDIDGTTKIKLIIEKSDEKNNLQNHLKIYSQKMLDIIKDFKS